MNFRRCLILSLLLFASPALSQNAYERCVALCLAEGEPEDVCRYELCDPNDTTGGVDTGQGNPLMLFSYDLTGPAPVIDGSLMSRDGDPTSSEALDEWKTAASRTLILSDSGVAQLFLTNTADTLYVGVTYEHGNNGDGSGVTLYLKEGSASPPGALDGGSDQRLWDANGLCNEQAVSVTKSGASIAVSDKCWNGAAWVNDGDGQSDFRAARYFFNSDRKVHHYEFAVPLNSAKSDDSANSDLDVAAGDAVGFYLEVVKSGAGAGTFHWIETNGNRARPDTFPYWGRIRLGVQRNFFTLYAGRTPGAPPTVDGRIQESAWNGAYQRDFLMSNYQYGTVPAKVWALEDSAGDQIYVGVRVYDGLYDTGDFCQIYFEERGENATDSIRDYDLDGGAGLGRLHRFRIPGCAQRRGPGHRHPPRRVPGISHPLP